MKLDENQVDFLNKYEQELLNECLRHATQASYLNGQLFETTDVTELWDEIAPEYMADAVPNVVQYPLVAIAWAAYLGIAYVYLWDKDWVLFNEEPNPYKYVVGMRGFDLLDEYVCNEIIRIGYETTEGQSLENILRSMAEICQNRIRKEQIEPQSQLAFHVFARSVKVMYRIGAALELARLGYKYEKL